MVVESLKPQVGTTCRISTADSSETSFAIVSLDGQLRWFFSQKFLQRKVFLMAKMPGSWGGWKLPKISSIMLPETLAREKRPQKTLDVFKTSTRLKHLQGDFTCTHNILCLPSDKPNILLDICLLNVGNYIFKILLSVVEMLCFFTGVYLLFSPFPGCWRPSPQDLKKSTHSLLGRGPTQKVYPL